MVMGIVMLSVEMPLEVDSETVVFKRAVEVMRELELSMLELEVTGFMLDLDSRVVGLFTSQSSSSSSSSGNNRNRMLKFSSGGEAGDLANAVAVNWVHVRWVWPRGGLEVEEGVSEPVDAENKGVLTLT